MTATAAAMDTWYSHLTAVDHELAASLEVHGISGVSDLYDELAPEGGPGARLILAVGEHHALAIAKELEPVC